MRIECYAQWNPIGWIEELFKSHNHSPLMVAQKEEFLHFAAVLLEQAWMNRNKKFHSDNLEPWDKIRNSELANSFVGEARATLQALNLAEEHGWEQVTFEADSPDIVRALNEEDDCIDWCGADFIKLGRDMLSKNNKWRVGHMVRICNRAAHHLARWGADDNISRGYIPQSLLLCTQALNQD
ncbi:hypothetical protein M9H77_16472 [Catharanthus roseus]|uniref:Uncharacterized protein n=1 Tax=Catharanthus roseus TaxID=4058 RepID=A0ACC0B1V6_CATRO|nr:hypothetical protein M9H77_16472 [Catharanthus roseus]